MDPLLRLDRLWQFVRCLQSVDAESLKATRTNTVCTVYVSRQTTTDHNANHGQSAGDIRRVYTALNGTNSNASLVSCFTQMHQWFDWNCLSPNPSKADVPLSVDTHSSRYPKTDVTMVVAMTSPLTVNKRSNGASIGQATRFHTGAALRHTVQYSSDDTIANDLVDWIIATSCCCSRSEESINKQQSVREQSLLKTIK